MRRTVITVVTVTAALALAGCGSSVNPDEEGLRYDAPPMSGKSFSDCVKPGEYNVAAPWAGAEYFAYPAGLRTYSFRTDGKGFDSPAFKVNTKDGVEMHVQGVVSFHLNTDCVMLRKFHEQVGIKFQAWMDEGKPSEGWDKLLDTFLGQSIQRAMSDATTGIGWQPLYSDPTTKTQWEAKVKAALPAYVKQAMGGDFFDQFSITIQKPEIPTDLADALRAAQVAAQQTKAQQQRNAQIDVEAESIRKLVAILGPDGYNTYLAIKSGKVNVLPIPQGSSVIVQPAAAAVTPAAGTTK